MAKSNFGRMNPMGLPACEVIAMQLHQGTAPAVAWHELTPEGRLVCRRHAAGLLMELSAQWREENTNG